VGGFKGDWEKAPSGINQSMKLDLLKEEGVNFTPEGKLIVKDNIWFDGPWDVKKTKNTMKTIKEKDKDKAGT